jgi:hypothetical protein
MDEQPFVEDLASKADFVRHLSRESHNNSEHSRLDMTDTE